VVVCGRFQFYDGYIPFLSSRLWPSYHDGSCNRQRIATSSSTNPSCQKQYSQWYA